MIDLCSRLRGGLEVVACVVICVRSSLSEAFCFTNHPSGFQIAVRSPFNIAVISVHMPILFYYISDLYLACYLAITVHLSPLAHCLGVCTVSVLWLYCGCCACYEGQLDECRVLLPWQGPRRPSTHFQPPDDIKPCGSWS